MIKQGAPVHYREYIQSEFWTERKRTYFQSHPHKCAVCGHPDVDLHHLRYGDYGHERDKDLAPLCRVHHQELHEKTGVRKDTSYQSNALIEEMRVKWEGRLDEPIRVASKKSSTGDFAGLVKALAAPIWRILGK